MDGEGENIYNRTKGVPRSSQRLKRQTFVASQERQSVAATTEHAEHLKRLDDAIKAGEKIRSMGERADETSRLPQDTSEPIRSDEPDRAAREKIAKLGSDLDLG